MVDSCYPVLSGQYVAELDDELDADTTYELYADYLSTSSEDYEYADF
jgi:hypothetical protein